MSISSDFLLCTIQYMTDAALVHFGLVKKLLDLILSWVR